MAELSELRQDVLRKKRDHLEAPQVQNTIYYKTKYIYFSPVHVLPWYLLGRELKFQVYCGARRR